MFKNLSYKKQFIYLQFTVAILVVLSYNFAIKRTLLVRNEYIKVQEELESLQNAPEQIGVLNEKLNTINNSINNLYRKEQSVQDMILGHIASFCENNNVIIKDFPKPNQIKKEDFIIETNTILLEGKFFPLIQLLYRIEQKYKLGKVSSARFYSKRNNKTKKLELFLELYIQNIKS